MKKDSSFYDKSSELIFNSLDLDIMLISKDFKVLFANESFLKRSGMKEKDVVGHRCYEVTHKRRSPCVPPKDPCPIQSVIRTGKPVVVTHTHSTKEGDRLVNITASALGKGDELCFLHITMPSSESKVADMKEAMKKTRNILGVLSLYQSQLNEVENTKNILEGKVDELEKFNKLMVGRELKMAELKKKIDVLERH